MELARIYTPIADDLAAVAAGLATLPDPRLARFVGGKRLRPALVLFAAQRPTGGVDPDARVMAATLEMVHTASLIHDDVLDSTARRRSGPALHTVLGVKPAVILADFLFVEGLAQLERISSASLVPEVVREVRTMCEGQWLEIVRRREGGVSAERYFEVIEKKTAALFAFCCRGGGRTRQAPAGEIAALDEFGRSFGHVYQLLDDAQDLNDKRPDKIERELLRWGGNGWLRCQANRWARRARTALRRIPGRATRIGLARLLAHVMEV